MSTLIRINRDHDDSRRAWLVGHPCMTTREWTHLEGERRIVSRLQQTDTGVEWANKKHGDKKNQGVEQTGSGTRNFGSELEAFRFKNSFSYLNPEDQPHPWAGDVVVRMLTGADTFEEVMLPNAVLALDPILGGGQSLQLGYNVKAGYVQDHRAGEVKYLTAQGASGVVATMNFFGDKVDGELSDSVTPDTDTEAAGWTIPTGYYLEFVTYSETDLDVDTIRFRVGAAAGGFTQLAYPLDLTELATHLDALISVAAEVVTVGGRACLLITGDPTHLLGTEGLAGSRIRCRIALSSSFTTGLKYDGSTYGNAVQPKRLTVGGKPLLVDVAL